MLLAPDLDLKAAPPSSGFSITDPAYALLIGPGLDVIDNLFEARAGVNGANELAVSIRFRATDNSAFSKIKNYWSAGSGYAAGTGGRILIRIFPDDGSGRPAMSGAPLAQVTYTPATNGMSGGKYPNGGTWPAAPSYAPGSQGFFDLTLSSSTSPVIGNLYHVVYTNTDAAPSVNWSTIDCSVAFTANGRGHRWLKTSDWGLLIGSRSASGGGAFSWEDRTVNPYQSAYWSGICQITYASGKRQGFSAMETGNSTPSSGGPYLYTISNGSYVQEVFTIPAAMQLAGFSVQTAASVAGSLNWQLIQGGTTIGSGTISRATANYTTISPASYPNLPRSVFTWEDLTFSAPINIAAGTLILRLAPTSGTWKFAGQRNGTEQGFSVHAVPSVGQYFNGSTLVNQFFWDHSNNSHSDGNWRVVLQKAAAGAGTTYQSIRLSSASDHLSIAVTGSVMSNAYTLLGLGLMQASTGTWTPIACIDNAGGRDFIGTGTNGAIVQAFKNWAASSSSAVHTLIAGQWFGWALVGGGSPSVSTITAHIFAGGTLYSQTLASGAASAVSRLLVGGNSFNQLSGNVSKVRFWNQTLTAAQIQSEFAASTPVVTTGLLLSNNLSGTSLTAQLTNSIANASWAMVPWTANGAPTASTVVSSLPLAPTYRSIVFDAAADCLRLAVTGSVSSHAYTFLGRGYQNLSTGLWTPIACVDTGGGRDFIGSASGTSLIRAYKNWAAASSADLASLVSGQWFGWALVGAGTASASTLTAYLFQGGVLYAQTVAAGSATSISQLVLGGNTFDMFAGNLTDVRFWSRALTGSQVQAEFGSGSPVIATDLQMANSFAGGALAAQMSNTVANATWAASPWVAGGTVASSSSAPSY